MRITDSMIFQDATTFTAAARTAAETAQAQVSTGVRVQHAGDDAAAAGLMVAHGIAAQQLTAIATGAKSAAAELTTADGALQSVNDALNSATQLATEMANDTNSASDRGAAATQVAQITASILSDLNAKSGNRYLFSGNKDQTQPFDAAGTFNGDTGVRQVEVAPGVLQTASVRADVAIKGAGGGVDVLSVLSKLQAALSANDSAGISASISSLRQGTAQVSSARTGAGVAIDTFTTAAALANTQRDQETQAVSNLGSVDSITAASSLALAQRGLEAAITASAQGFRLTLLNKIG